MRTRSSGLTDEDETDEVSPAEAARRPSDGDGRKRSFTSAKHDGSRHSDALDRRKGEKSSPSLPVLHNAWKPSPGIHAASEMGLQTLEPLGQDTPTASMPEARTRRRSKARNPWACSLLTITTTFLSLLFLLSIFHSFTTRQLDPKGCEMCMMSPAYAKLSDFDTEHTRFASKYSLYLYREGGIDEDTKAGGPRPVVRQLKLMIYRSRAFLYSLFQGTPAAISKSDRLLRRLRNTFTIAFNKTRRH